MLHSCKTPPRCKEVRCRKDKPGKCGGKPEVIRYVFPQAQVYSLTHLYCKFGANACDGVPHVHALIHRDDVGLARSHALHEAPAVADVQDQLQVGVCLAHTLDDLAYVGFGEHVKVLRRQLRRPGVEDLHHLRAVVRLWAMN